MKEVPCQVGNLADQINLLLKYKESGESVFLSYRGHTFYSDTVTMDSAYLEVFGKTKEEYDKEKKKAVDSELEFLRLKDNKTENERKLMYKLMVLQTRDEGIDIHIEMPTVIAGLKFIVENPELPHEELVQGLLDLGCNFTYSDYDKQFTENESTYLIDGLKERKLQSGADVIINVRDTEFGRALCRERMWDTVFEYIRALTGDESYTRENVESGNTEKGSKK